VPVLREGEIVIWDSLAIAEYIAERVPDLWPRAVAARAHARSLAAEMHAGFAAIRNALPMNCRAMHRQVTLTPAVAGEIRRIQEIIADCRGKYAAGGPWLFGTFTVADAMYAPVMSRFITYGIETDSPCSDYAGTVMRDPEVVAWYAAAAAESETIAIAEAGAH
jgi:glutathione S-transferase